MIGIIDYGSGNVSAISRVYNNLNVPSLNITKPDQLEDVGRVILPGVGAFDYTMSLLNSSGFKKTLEEHVIDRKKPILGICVGLQVMSYGSDEGSKEGFGWIPGRVKRFCGDKINFKPKLPHMGWNTVNDFRSHPLLVGIDNDLGFYFCQIPSKMRARNNFHI